MLTEKEIKNITELSLTAGKEILQIYNSNNFDVKIKSDNSPLTKTDKISHKIIKEGLLKLFHNVPVLSEEGKEIPFVERKNWDKFWLVDPLDGTKEFIKKNGEFTVNIALIENRYPVFGIITIPVTGEIYYGGKEYGSWKNNQSIQVSNKSLKDELSFEQFGINIEWVGNKENEKGIISEIDVSKSRFDYEVKLNRGDIVVEISPKYYRPTEVDLLIGKY